MSELSTAARVVEAAIERGLKLAVAESLTGGLLSDALVSVPGTSAVFTGAVVSYHTEVKRRLLGVDGLLLDEHGPVHPEVAKQMAAGVRLACGVGSRPRSGSRRPALPALIPTLKPASRLERCGSVSVLALVIGRSASRSPAMRRARISGDRR